MAFKDLLKKGLKTLTGDVYGNLMTAGGNMIGGFVNEFFADRARQKNYEYNERAADAADKRQRAQYKDLYSPEAMLAQYRAAGLSPSIMMSGGQSAVGGTPSGAQGSTSGGYPAAGGGSANAMLALQLEQLKADIRNTNADTELKNTENNIRKIDKDMKELAQSQYAKEFTLMNMNLKLGNKAVTYRELAANAKNYDDFWKEVKKATEWEDSGTTHFMASEAGQQIMRAIYMANKTLNHDIKVLSSSEVNAEFQEQITNFLKNSEYSQENAKAAVQQLKSISAQAELSETQKNAWNNLIEKLGDGTWKDIIVVLTMILGNFMNGHANIKIGGSLNQNIQNHNNKTWNKFAVE